MGDKLVLSMDRSFYKLMGDKLYSSPAEVIAVRELLQNARDAVKAAGGGSIDFSLARDKESGAVTLVCEDQGIGMDRDTILGKFLCLGGTSKRDDSGNVGGFGVAKLSLFQADSWQVSTNEFYLDSDMLDRQDDLGVDHNTAGKGTRIKLVFDGDHGGFWNSELLRDCLGMLYFSELGKGVDLRVFIDWDNLRGIVLDDIGHYDGGAVLSASSEDSDRGWSFGVYGRELINLGDSIHQAFEGSGLNFMSRKVVRLGGLVQFIDQIYESEFTDILTCDFECSLSPDHDNYPFTMSREELEYPGRRALNEVVGVLVRDFLSTRSKIVEADQDYESPRAYGGDVLIEGRKFAGAQAAELAIDDLESLVESLRAVAAGTRRRRGHKAAMFDGDSDPGKFRLYVKDYDGDPRVGDLKIVLIYAFLVSLVTNDDFAMGLSGDPSIAGARGMVGDHTVYFINPDSFKDLDRGALPFALWHLAIHEACHAFFPFHNEGFTSAEGDLSRESAGPFYDGLKVCRQLIRRKIV